MKFRVIRTNGRKYIVETKRKFWFWRKVCDRYSDHAGDIYIPHKFDSTVEAERYVRRTWGEYVERVYYGNRVVI